MLRTYLQGSCGDGDIGCFFFFIIIFIEVYLPRLVKNLPVIWETWARSLGWEDALEKGRATHSSILSWRIPWNV